MIVLSSHARCGSGLIIVTRARQRAPVLAGNVSVIADWFCLDKLSAKKRVSPGEVRMHRFGKVLVCAIVMSFGSGVARADASYPETVRLVRSMRADELLIAALHAGLDGDTRAGKWTKEQAACLSKVKYPLLTDAVALSLSSKLTDAEVAEAIAFYRSDVGRKVTQHTYQDLKGKLDTNILRGLSAEEASEVARFSKRPAGRKLIQEQIVNRPDVQQRVAQRLRLTIDDCEYQATNSNKEWVSSPVRAPDGACSAMKAFVDYGEDLRTQIQLSCSGFGHAYTVAQFKGRLDGVDFRWREGNAIEVIHPAGAVPAPRGGNEKFKIIYRQRTPKDPPAPKTWPRAQLNAAGRVDLDALASPPFWMSYVDGERCLLTRRIERSQLPGMRNHDEVVQFMKVSTPEYPFGTTELVMFETASGSESKSAVIRGPKLDLPMIPGVRGFHLQGRAAETVLRALAGGGLQIEIQPASGASFRIDLAPTDIDWALPPFEQCAGGVKTSMNH
jgi:hypothetical protein